MNFLISSLLISLVSVSALAFQFHGSEFKVVEQIENRGTELIVGEETTVDIYFKIKEGYHIQADQVLDDNLIPSSINFESNNLFAIGEIEFPERKTFKLRDTDEILWVFSDEISIGVQIKVNRSTKPGEHHIRGTFYYQACDDARCLFPRELKFSLKVLVKKEVRIQKSGKESKARRFRLPTL